MLQRTNLLLAVTVLVTISLPACTKGKPEETEEDKKRHAFLADHDAKSVAKLEPKLAFLKGLKGKLPPPTSTDGVQLGKNWLNELWVNEENLESPAGTINGVETDKLTLLRRCVEGLVGTWETRVGSKISDCADARYAYVIRVQKKVLPAITKYGTKDEQGGYSPGVANGDILVYDLEEKKHIGGVKWEATNQGTLHKQSLESDFNNQIKQAVETAALHIKRP